MLGLEHGRYTKLVGLDVPLPADVAYKLLCHPGVRSVELALHLHAAETSVLGKQVATWYPTEYNTFEFPTTGSVGEFLISVDGRALAPEVDNAWLSMQLTVNGVKPEMLQKIGTYTIMRLTKARNDVLVPRIVPSILKYCKRGSGPCYVEVSTPGRNPCRMIRVSDELTLLTDDVGVFSTTGQQLRDAYSGIAARVVDMGLRRKAVSALAREDGSRDPGRLIAVLLDLELQNQSVRLDAWDSPTSATRWSWVPFAWCFNGITRRSFAQNIIERSRGAGRSSCKTFQLVFAIFCAIMSVMPWPSIHCSEGLPHPPPDNEPEEPGHVLPGTYCRIGPDLGSRVAIRILLLIVATFNLTTLAYAADTAYFVRAAYVDDRFAPIYYEGTLPLGFGLPGYVADYNNLKPLAIGSKIRIKDPEKWVDPEKPRDNLFAVGLVFAGWLPSVTVPCQQNLVVALRNRQLAEMPLPDEEFFDEQSKRYLLQFRHQGDVRQEDFNAWNDRFDTTRRAKHAKARDNWVDCSVTEFLATVRKGFTKMEKVLRVAKVWSKAPYDPRVITGATDEFNVVWGLYFFQARDLLKSAYSDLPNNVLLASGKSSRTLGEWFETALASEGRAICGDDQLVIVRGILLELDGVRHSTN